MIDSSSKVLVVDDFELVRVMLQKALGDLGIKSVFQAEHGEEAFQLLVKAYDEGQPYKLIFLDWNMPVLDGFGFLQKCRADERFKSIFIVMVTAESERAYVLKALSSGATDYVTKPFSVENLKEKIKVLNRKLNMN